VAAGGARGRPQGRLHRRGRYPEAQPEKIDEAAIAYVGRIKQMVDACRALRGEMGVSPAQRLPLLAVAGNAEDSAFLRANADVLKNLAKLSEVKVFDDEAAWATAASRPGQRGGRHPPGAVRGDRRGSREGPPVQGSQAPRRRDQGQRQAEQRSLLRQGPAAVLEQERKRLADFGATLTRINEQLARLG
jgi:valyl-tRNA synthetase